MGAVIPQPLLSTDWDGDVKRPLYFPNITISVYAPFLSKYVLLAGGSTTTSSLGAFTAFSLIDNISFHSCSKICFDPYFIMDMETDDIFCFAMFNKDAKSMANLAGPDGKLFVEAAKESMLISPEEDKSFMWYKCSSML